MNNGFNAFINVLENALNFYTGEGWKSTALRYGLAKAQLARLRIEFFHNQRDAKGKLIPLKPGGCYFDVKFADAKKVIAEAKLLKVNIKNISGTIIFPKLLHEINVIDLSMLKQNLGIVIKLRGETPTGHALDIPLYPLEYTFSFKDACAYKAEAEYIIKTALTH